MIQEIELHTKQGMAYTALRPTDTTHNFVGFGGGAYGGKSWLGCTWLLTMALEFPMTRWFMGREELKRLRRSTLQTMFKVLREYNVPNDYWQLNGQDHYLQFLNESRIDLLELKYMPRDPLYERFGSEEYTGGWIEEAGEVHFGAFDILKSRIGRQMNDEYGIHRKLLITFNPKKNWLYKTFYLPWKNGTLPDNYLFVQSLYGDNPYRDSAAEQGLEQIENKTQRQRLKDGLWEYDDAPDQLIKYEWVEQAQKIQAESGIRSLGIDIARYGDDATILCQIEGNELLDCQFYRDKDISEVTDISESYIETHSIQPKFVAVDTVGLGAGVYDNLKHDEYKCQEFVAGAKPLQDQIQKKSRYEFADLRSQMWWYVREQLRQGQLCLANIDKWPPLLEDLTAPTYQIEQEKKIRVEPKEKIKERLGRSTDYGDAFVQAIAAPRIRFGQKIITSPPLPSYVTGR